MSLLIAKARAFAIKAHDGQTRKNNDLPYIVHPSRVADYIRGLPNATEEMVAAAWLHDVVEDCGVSLDEIKAEFGDVVARIVGEVTDPPKSARPNMNRAARKAEDKVRLSLASREAKILKLVDRIDNVKDMIHDVLDGLDLEFARLYADESFSLAHVLMDADARLASILFQAIERLRAYERSSSSVR